MIQTFDILVCGELVPSLSLSADGAGEQSAALVLSAGCPAAVFACGAARLGLKVAFAGVCGADVFGRFVLDEMAQSGVDIGGVSLDPLIQTGLRVSLRQPGSPATLTHPWKGSRLPPGQVTHDRLLQSRHLHVAGCFQQGTLLPELPGLVKLAHTLGLTTSLETGWEPGCAWDGFDELLAELDVYLPGEAEALALAGLADNQPLEQAAQTLARACDWVAVKPGLAARGKHVARAEMLPVQSVDASGAGASFDAGIIYGFLKGWELEETLALAAACAALSQREAGGTHAQPTLEEAMQLIQSVG